MVARARKNGTAVPRGGIGKLIGPALRLTLMAVYEDHARAFGDSILTPQRNAVLRNIAASPGTKQTDLADRLGIARSGVMILLNALEEAGMVERREHPTDKRSNGLHLTRAGKKAMDEFARQIAIHDTDLTHGISDKDRAIFFSVLERIAENANRSSKE